MSTQRQDSLADQMQSVEQLATEAGCYDAVDWIRAAWDGKLAQLVALQRDLDRERARREYLEAALRVIASYDPNGVAGRALAGEWERERE